jgi:hypothetical protein
MVAAPVLVPIESRSTTHDTEALRFQRLERVRAQRRARRRYRFFLITTLAIVLAGGGVLGFVAIRRTSFERLGSPSSPPPVVIVKPAAAAPAATTSAPVPLPEDGPQPTRAGTVRRGATQPSRIQVETDRATHPLSNSEGPGAVAPSRDEPHDAEVVDPAAAIDWLLKRPGHDAANAPNGGEEKLQ